MKDNQLPEHNRIAFDEFSTWKADLLDSEGLDLSEQQEDWEPWWLCFLAGWKAKRDSL